MDDKKIVCLDLWLKHPHSRGGSRNVYMGWVARSWNIWRMCTYMCPLAVRSCRLMHMYLFIWKSNKRIDACFTAPNISCYRYFSASLQPMQAYLGSFWMLTLACFYAQIDNANVVRFSHYIIYKIYQNENISLLALNMIQPRHLCAGACSYQTLPCG